jgi:hypothetical protein
MDLRSSARRVCAADCGYSPLDVLGSGRAANGMSGEWDVWRLWSPMGTLLLGGERCEYDRQDAYPTTESVCMTGSLRWIHGKRTL